ncbi:hypothetical protein BSKO_12216 [Bryopsis sp. KO-2023]|nr:hypothetical protein BSKO_12216 [Bryopsis sp. KO-2023]
MQCRARCLEKTVRRGWRGSDWVLNTIEKSFWSAVAGEDFRLDGFGSVNQYICSRGLSFSNTFEPNERTPVRFEGSTGVAPFRPTFHLSKAEKASKPKNVPKEIPRG